MLILKKLVAKGLQRIPRYDADGRGQTRNYYNLGALFEKLPRS